MRVFFQNKLKYFQNKDILFFLIFLPIPLNFILNYFSSPFIESILTFNYFDFFSSILLFCFLYIVGRYISENLNLPYVSTGIVVYILSYFVLDNFILFFYVNITNKNLFFITNALWFIYIVFLLYC